MVSIGLERWITKCPPKLPHETGDLFAALPPELEGVQPAPEPEREIHSGEDRTSIAYFAELQRAYWNLAFPSRKK